MAAKSALLVAAALTAAALTLGPSPALAAPKPSESELRAELKQLNEKVDKLIERYNAKRVELAKAQEEEKAAEERLAAADAQLADAESLVRKIAQAYYQGDPAIAGILPPSSADGAAVIAQVTEEQQAVVQSVQAMRDARQRAADAAAALTVKIKQDAAEVADQREEAEDLIADIRKKLEQLVPYGTGRRSDGTWAPELPSGPDHITPRTRLMRDQIKKTFDLKYTVGCYRVDDSGEHPLGRACDFMMSQGGSMPSAADSALGDQIAAWALKNMDRLGVKYVIWKQRINMGSGWRAMEDRGSITANHWDHVHISMH
ncbi:coiled-coil domain-containing protein [Thermoactinospora rubra]|uniref:coiled-coil domain-containing protein n=1 Tax=Thermoactinospora rubra TaxID=1088767 RepID=UPI000A116047|nr:hypothetical protein [Thermoactinospora rubra]